MFCTQFFGFKNPFVQRLLRELAANVNGTAERSLVPSSFCNGASRRTDVDNRFPDACPYLAIPRITGKRSRRREIVNSKSFSWTSIKRTRPEDLTSFAKPSDSVKGSKRYHNNGNSTLSSSLEEEYDICKYSKASPTLVHLVPAHQEESDFSVKDSLPLDSVGFSNHPRMDAVHEETRLFVGSGNCKSTVVASNLSVDEEKPVSTFPFFIHLASEPQRKLKSLDYFTDSHLIHLSLKTFENTCFHISANIYITVLSPNYASLCLFIKVVHLSAILHMSWFCSQFLLNETYSRLLTA